MLDSKENLPPLLPPTGDNFLIKNSCASSLQSHVNDEQVISLKKQLKQQANEFSAAKALWGQKIELLTKENEELKIREGHLKMMNESLLNLWNEFNDSSGKSHNNKEMQMIIELHDKEAQAEKERNTEFMKRFELENKSLRDKLQQTELRQQELELRHENELCALNLRIKDLDKERRNLEETLKKKAIEFSLKSQEMSEKYYKMEATLNGEILSAKNELVKIEGERTNLQKKETERLKRTMNEAKRSQAEQILTLKKTIEENQKKIAALEAVLKKTKTSLSSSQVMNENTSRLLREKMNQIKSLLAQNEELNQKMNQMSAELKRLRSLSIHCKRETIITERTPEKNSFYEFSSYGEYLKEGSKGPSWVPEEMGKWMGQGPVVGPAKGIYCEESGNKMGEGYGNGTRGRSLSQPHIRVDANNQPRHKKTNTRQPSIIPEEFIEETIGRPDKMYIQPPSPSIPFSSQPSCSILPISISTIPPPSVSTIPPPSSSMIPPSLILPSTAFVPPSPSSLPPFSRREELLNQLEGKLNLSEIHRNPCNSSYLHCRTLTPSNFEGLNNNNSYMEKLIEENSLLNRELTSVLRELKAETSRKNDSDLDIREQIGKLSKKVEGKKKEGEIKRKRRGGGGGRVEDEGEVKSCNSSFMVTKTMKTLNGDR